MAPTPTSFGQYNCGETIVVYDNGNVEFVYEIYLGNDIGNVVLNYDSFSTPDRYVVEWNGIQVIDTGYRGNPSYNSQLKIGRAHV